MKRIAILLVLLALTGCTSIKPWGTANVTNHVAGRDRPFSGYGFFVGNKGCFATVFHLRSSSSENTTLIQDGLRDYKLEFLQGIPELDLTLYRTEMKAPTLPLTHDFYRPEPGEHVWIVSRDKIEEAKIGAPPLFEYIVPRKPFIPELYDKVFLAYKIEGKKLGKGKSGAVVVNRFGEIFAMITMVSLDESNPFGAAIPVSYAIMYPFLNYHRC